MFKQCIPCKLSSRVNMCVIIACNQQCDFFSVSPFFKQLDFRPTILGLIYGDKQQTYKSIKIFDSPCYHLSESSIDSCSLLFFLVISVLCRVTKAVTLSIYVKARRKSRLHFFKVPIYVAPLYKHICSQPW